MSSDSTTASSNFQAIFNTALVEYRKQTGEDLRNHPLASEIDSCDSADSIVNIFKEQAKTFDEFRKGDSTKLVKWLEPVVKVLHALSKNDVLNDAVSHVSPGTFLYVHPVDLNSLSTRLFHRQSRFYLLSGSFYLCVPTSLSPPYLFSYSGILDGQKSEGQLRRPT